MDAGGQFTLSSLDGVAELVPAQPRSHSRSARVASSHSQLAQEGWGWSVDLGSFIGPGAGWGMFGGSDVGDSSLIGRYGGFWPADRVQLPNHSTPGIFTEPQWRAGLMWHRWLGDHNPLAIGFTDAIVNFIGSMEVAWVRRGQSPGAVASGEDSADPLLEAVEQVWDEWCEANDWGEGDDDREVETSRRLLRDGEVWLRMGPGGAERNRLPWIRNVEPEQVRTPTGTIPGDWSQASDDWRWGIHCDPADAEHELAYWVCDPDSGGAKGEVVTAAEMIRSKSNVDRTIRRGLSDYFCVESHVQQVIGILGNMEGTAREQSRVAWIQEWAQATPDQLRSMLNAPPERAGGAGAWDAPGIGPSGSAPALAGGGWGGRGGFPIRTHNGTTVLHVGPSVQFQPGPTSTGVPSYNAVCEATLKTVGFRFHVPDWFAGAGADGFASVLVTGSPFVRAIETRQEKKVGITKKIAVKVIDLAEKSGRLPVGTGKQVRPIVTSKPVIIADEGKQVSTWSAELAAKTLDPQEWIRKRGRDPKVVAANIKAWEAEFAPPAPPPGSGAPGDAPGGGQGPNPASQEPTPAPPGSAGGDGSNPQPQMVGEHAPGTTHKFSSTQIDLAGEAAAAIRELSRQVKDADLVDRGRETAPHVTILYGLHDADPDDVAPILRSSSPIDLYLGAVSFFACPDYDVLKVDVASAGLVKLNAALKKLPHTQTHPGYHPHATIAHVRSGAGAGYAAKFKPLAIEETVTKAIFSGRTGSRAVVNLMGATESWFGASGSALGDWLFRLNLVQEADRGHLRRKQITNKNGVKTWVWYNPDRARDVPGASPLTGTATGKTQTDPHGADYSATLESETAVARAINDPATLRADQLEELGKHLDVLQKSRLQNLARQIEARIGGKKAELVQRLLDHVHANQPKHPQPGDIAELHADEIAVDPHRFQFKQKVNAAGVTPELLGIESFNPELAGIISVWRDPADGRTYVVNGHHRVELASRAGYKGKLAVRYLDAKDAREARAKGALINLAEGRGTATDAAKFMRDSGVTPEDLEKHGVSLKGKLAADAAVLTKVNDQAFDRVARGQLDQDRAIAVAKHLADPTRQERLFHLLDQREEEGKDYSNRTVEEMARNMAAVPSTKRIESTLWGTEETDEDTFVERAELAGFVRAELAKEQHDFGAVASERRAGKVSGAGNVLNTSENQKRADAAEHAKNLFAMHANLRGAIADALDAGAVNLKGAKTKKQKETVRAAIYAAVRDAISAKLSSAIDPNGKGGVDTLRGGTRGAEPGTLRESAPPGEPRRGSPTEVGVSQEGWLSFGLGRSATGPIANPSYVPAAVAPPASPPPPPTINPEHAQAAADYAQHGTRSKAFKSWFGDWEAEPHNASKVVHPHTGEPQETAGASVVTQHDGTPKVVYHGTTHGAFDAFDPKHVANANHLHFGPGFYFTEDHAAAQEFARGAAGGANGGNPAIMKLHLNVRNPFDVDQHKIDPRELPDAERLPLRAAIVQQAFNEDGRSAALDAGRAFDRGEQHFDYKTLTGRYGVDKKAIREMLEKKGHDGLTVNSPVVSDPSKARYWIAFHPNQVKSVHNRGTFDPTSDKIAESYFTREYFDMGHAVRRSNEEAAALLASRVRESVLHFLQSDLVREAPPNGPPLRTPTARDLSAQADSLTDAANHSGSHAVHQAAYYAHLHAAGVHGASGNYVESSTHAETAGHHQNVVMGIKPFAKDQDGRYEEPYRQLPAPTSVPRRMNPAAIRATGSGIETSTGPDLNRLRRAREAFGDEGLSGLPHVDVAPPPTAAIVRPAGAGIGGKPPARSGLRASNRVDVEAIDHTTGVAHAARVGVPGMQVPRKIPRLSNLTPRAQKAQEQFAAAYEANPEKMHEDYRQEALRDSARKKIPPTFGTDDAKVLAEPWGGSDSQPSEQRAINRATLNTALHATANATAKGAFLKHLDTLDPGDEVTVTNGGVAAGKGFALKNVPAVKAIRDKSRAVWDSAGDQNATENPWVQQEAEKRGLKVHYVYVHADPRKQWTHGKAGAVHRAAQPDDGRMVDSNVFADSYDLGAKNHAAFEKAMQGNPNATFHYLDNDPDRDPKIGPQLLPGMPAEALEVNRHHLARFAQGHIARTRTIPAHVAHGATMGYDLWPDEPSNLPGRLS